MAMHGNTKGVSFSKSNHPAQKKGKEGLSGMPGKPGKHGSLVGKENPTDRTNKMSMSKGKPKPAGDKSMAGLNPLFHPGNKMAKS